MRRFDTTAKTHRPVYTDVRRFGTGNNILCTRPYSLDYLLLRCRRTAGSMLSTARRSDLELRARIFLDHQCLYEPDGPAWARRVTSPAWSIDGKLRFTAIHSGIGRGRRWGDRKGAPQFISARDGVGNGVTEINFDLNCDLTTTPANASGVIAVAKPTSAARRSRRSLAASSPLLL
jgi:hypothetical protein